MEAKYKMNNEQTGTPTGKSVTHEEFLQLEIAQLRIDRIKAKLWDIERYAENILNQIQQLQQAQENDNGKNAVAQLQNQFNEIRERHNSYSEELNEALQEMNKKFTDIMSKYNIENQKVLIEENEPHEIKVL